MDEDFGLLLKKSVTLVCLDLRDKLPVLDNFDVIITNIKQLNELVTNKKLHQNIDINIFLSHLT